ncbi:hypothetical protein [Streptomyces milbemycinicus]|uniref:hypothetical protein n=1 Tax=Streptomyces milbemycinicus TaxID=476552 RepID=UPI0033FFB292
MGKHGVVQRYVTQPQGGEAELVGQSREPGGGGYGGSVPGDLPGTEREGRIRLS